MGIKVQKTDIYKDSVRKLFPRGSYWDEQFKNPKSDCSLFCEAKSAFIQRARGYMLKLQRESEPQTAEETLDDWERVLLGSAAIGYETAQRRTLLIQADNCNISRETIIKTGQIFGIEVTDITFPFFPGLFGHSHFGSEQLANLAAFSCLYIYASAVNEDNRAAFEKSILNTALSNYIIYFIYGET